MNLLVAFSKFEILLIEDLPFQLTYHSIARPDLNEQDIRDIMEVSMKNNAELNITGCLIYHNNFFLQILEGEKEVVLELFDRIKLDDRNDQVTLLSTDDSKSRIFKEWAMAYYHIPQKKELSPEEKEVKSELLQLSDTSKKPNFTLKVFWYNVRQILLSEGYYRNSLNIVPS